MSQLWYCSSLGKSLALRVVQPVCQSTDTKASQSTTSLPICFTARQKHLPNLSCTDPKKLAEFSHNNPKLLADFSDVDPEKLAEVADQSQILAEFSRGQPDELAEFMFLGARRFFAQN